MIIVTGSYGRLCNQIFLQAHLMAFGIERGITIVNPCFRDYSKFFQGTVNNALCCYPSLLSYLPTTPKARYIYYKLARLLDRVSRGINTELVGVSKINLDHLCYRLYPESPQDSSSHLISSINKLKNRICLFEGWYFRCLEGLRNQEEKIRVFFSPIPTIQKKVEEFHKQLVRFQYRIGVHIRHGDYQKNKYSQYYFPIQQYRLWINQVKATTNAQVCFVISTDTKENLSLLLQDNVYLCPGEPIVDLYCLAACNFIMGPPSTFNRWAAFYGKAKHLTLTDKNQQVAFDDFRDFKFRERAMSLPYLTFEERYLLDFGGVV